MILIRHIEFCEVEGDREVLRNTPLWGNVPVSSPSGEDTSIPMPVFNELVRGRRFIRLSDGKELVIGVSRQAQEVIGIMYEAWGEKDHSIHLLRKKYNDALLHLDHINERSVSRSATISKLKSASLWTRIKWVFRGVST